jgi:aminoglycoside phosphotransferase (APT) family kinase protein
LQNFIELAEQLLESILTFFPKSSTEDAEETYLHHHDVNWHNLLASDQGALTAILDWECVSTVPSWKACQYPLFL